ncbi:unnamed protein product, partial [Mesorhabditis belari]|uniref:C2H2-type domain-containing protein n=1 Tax=Mesorhabditis belari TaxID=2138241 RepID=A0AAF3EXF6_9BILA
MDSRPGCSKDTKESVFKIEANDGKIDLMMALFKEEEKQKVVIRPRISKMRQSAPMMKKEPPPPRPIIVKKRQLELYRKANGSQDSKLVSLVTPYVAPPKIQVTEEPTISWKVGRAICPGRCGRELSISCVKEHVSFGCPPYIQRPRGTALKKKLKGVWRSQRQICPGPCGKELSGGVIDEHLLHGCPGFSQCCLQCPFCAELFTTHLKLIHHCTEYHAATNVRIQQERIKFWEQVQAKIDAAVTSDAHLVKSKKNLSKFKNYRCSKELAQGRRESGEVHKVCPAYYNVELLEDGDYILRYCNVHVHGHLDGNDLASLVKLRDYATVRARGATIRVPKEETIDPDDGPVFSKIPLDQILQATQVAAKRLYGKNFQL